MWTASQHNTYVRDNFASLWPYTAAGDLAYAASSSSLAKLSSGTEGQILTVSSGVPAWTDQVQKFCTLKRNANQSISNNSRTNISFDTETFDNFGFFDIASPTVITLPEAGLYRFDGFIRYSAATAGVREMILFYNSNYYFIDSRNANYGVYTVSNGAYLLQIASPTTVNIQAFHTGGTALNATANVSVTYIGAI